MSRYEVGLCQKFNRDIHGFNPNTSTPEVERHYICLFTFDFTCNGLYLSASSLSKYYGATIEIVETQMLYPGDETIAIYKTFWLRIFQRICKRWLVQRRFSRSTRLYSFLLKREYQLTNTSI
jgi:hypothetical protein